MYSLRELLAHDVSMNTRDFGRTGLRISELVFGGGAVGGLLINADENTKRRAIDKALAAGINWIDTAPSYGQGRSEAAIGALTSGMAEPPHISTKFTIDTSDLSDVGAQIETSISASLARLGRRSVTLLQLHNPIGRLTGGRMLGADEILKPGGVLDALEALAVRGWFAHYGITALGDTDAILRVIASGRVASAQVYFNLLNPSAGLKLPGSWPAYDFHPVLEACATHRVAAMNIRVLSAGVIATDERTGRERPLTPGDTVESEASKAHRMFAVLGTRYGTRAQTAIRFALTEPRLACVVVGLAEICHLDDAIAAAQMGPLPEEAMARIRDVYGA